MNLLRFEPFGSNCEFGCVLRSLGNDRPSLFRWTVIDLPGVEALLENCFVDCFERSTIRPHAGEMVISIPYDWAFHSALHSTPEAGFTDPPERFEELFTIERARVLNDIEHFSQRLRGGDIVATFSTTFSATGVTDEEALAFLGAIDSFSGHEKNRLLVVGPPRNGSAGPGTIEMISDRVLRGTVAFLAPFDDAQSADHVNWKAILAQAAVV
jgi:hypothetical protein